VPYLPDGKYMLCRPSVQPLHTTALGAERLVCVVRRHSQGLFVPPASFRVRCTSVIDLHRGPCDHRPSGPRFSASSGGV